MLRVMTFDIASKLSRLTDRPAALRLRGGGRGRESGATEIDDLEDLVLYRRATGVIQLLSLASLTASLGDADELDRDTSSFRRTGRHGVEATDGDI